VHYRRSLVPLPHPGKLRSTHRASTVGYLSQVNPPAFLRAMAELKKKFGGVPSKAILRFPLKCHPTKSGNAFLFLPVELKPLPATSTVDPVEGDTETPRTRRVWTSEMGYMPAAGVSEEELHQLFQELAEEGIYEISALLEWEDLDQTFRDVLTRMCLYRNVPPKVGADDGSRP